MTRNLLVTGASGFIGTALVSGLANSGWQVRAAARDPAVIPALAGVERVAMPDLRAPADWAPLLEGMNYVVHLAGIAHAHGLLPEELYSRVNAEAVGELANAARGRVERFVFVSSTRSQIGFSSAEPITEELVPRPIDSYGRSKLLAEYLLAKSGAPFTVLRPTLTYGKGVKGNVARLRQLAKTGLPLPFGCLTNRRSLLAIENLITAIDFVLVHEQTKGETYLVADPEPISVAQMIAAMREGQGHPPNLINLPPRVMSLLLRLLGKQKEWERLSGSLVIDISKLKGIGWVPQVRTYDGLTKML